MKMNSPKLLLIFRCTFTLTLLITTYFSLIDTAELPAITRNIWDKFQHASAFVVLSFLLHRSFAERQLFSSSHTTQIVCLLGYGIIIEWLQGYTPHRESSFNDVFADAFGIFCYCTLFYLTTHPSQSFARRG